jgi:glutamate-1-semialdehyde 2,1-aminomutase
MAAGIATLEHLRSHPEIYARLDSLTKSLCEGLLCAAKKKGIKAQLNRAGAMWTLFFCEQPVTDWASASKADTKKFGSFHRAILERGIYLPPSQFEVCMLSAAHTESDIKQTIAAAEQSF